MKGNLGEMADAYLILESAQKAISNGERLDLNSKGAIYGILNFDPQGAVTAAMHVQEKAKFERRRRNKEGLSISDMNALACLGGIICAIEQYEGDGTPIGFDLTRGDLVDFCDAYRVELEIKMDASYVRPLSNL